MLVLRRYLTWCMSPRNSRFDRVADRGFVTVGALPVELKQWRKKDGIRYGDLGAVATELAGALKCGRDHLRIIKTLVRVAVAAVENRRRRYIFALTIVTNIFAGNLSCGPCKQIRIGLISPWTAADRRLTAGDRVLGIPVGRTVCRGTTGAGIANRTLESGREEACRINASLCHGRCACWVL